MASTMKTWVIPEHGGIEVLKLEERPIPEPGVGEVRVKPAVGALNHLDLWMRRGLPGMKIPLPLVPISDVAGTVDKTGADVSGLAEGTRIVLIPGRSCGMCRHCLRGDDPICNSYGIRGESFDGGASEYVVVPANEAIPIPDNLEFDTAAAFGLVFLTAFRMVFTRGRARTGDWSLVHAAGSGVSTAAIQLLKMIGARVITTAGSFDKVMKAKDLGVEHVINYKETDFVKEIRSVTGGGVDLIIDHIGKDTIEGNIKILNKGGRMVTCGTTSGAIIECNLALVFFKGLSILGSTMGSRAEFLKCLDIVSRGLATPVIDRKFRFEDYPKAQEHLESRKAFGKVLIGF